MTRREIALYKLASFSEKMQKRASEAEEGQNGKPFKESMRDRLTGWEAPSPVADQSDATKLSFGNTIKLNAPMLALLGLTGASMGGMFGGSEGRGKRRLLAALGLPSVYAAYLAAKNGDNGGLGGPYGITGWDKLDEFAKYVNYPFWYGAPTGLNMAWNSHANNPKPSDTTT